MGTMIIIHIAYVITPRVKVGRREREREGALEGCAMFIRTIIIILVMWQGANGNSFS